MRFDRIIKGGNVVTPAGSFTGDVGISGEKITALGVNLEGDASTKVIDARDHHVIPGVMDVHVHLPAGDVDLEDRHREPADGGKLVTSPAVVLWSRRLFSSLSLPGIIGRSARSGRSINSRSGRPRLSGPKTRASPGWKRAWV